METHKISGRWKVRRESGGVPPGLRLTVGERCGWAKLGFLPIGRFTIAGSTLVHRRLPLSEQLEFREGDTWYGRMMIGRRELGRFSLRKLRDSA